MVAYFPVPVRAGIITGRSYSTTRRSWPLLIHHDLRATFITQMLADNVPLGKIKEIVGHSKLSTTDRYLRKSGLDLRGATNCLSFEIPVAKQDGNVVPLKKNSVSLNFPQRMY